MIPAMRQQTIMDVLYKVDTASVTSLTDLLGVSHMTVRRDIQKLEQAGWVKSVAGGVLLVRKDGMAAPQIDKWHRTMSAEKEAIAIEAEKLLKPGETIFLDAGTTNLAFARHIATTGRKHEKSLIVTNDLMIASQIIENTHCQLFFAGGTVERDTRSCVNNSAAFQLKELNIDIAFIVPESWNSDFISVPNADKALIKKTVVNQANKRVLLSDSSKYGKSSAFKAIDITRFDTILSDTALPGDAQLALQKKGLEIRLADVTALMKE